MGGGGGALSFFFPVFPFFALSNFGFSIVVSSAVFGFSLFFYIRFSVSFNKKSGFSVSVIRLSSSSIGLIAFDNYSRWFFGFERILFLFFGFYIIFCRFSCLLIGPMPPFVVYF